MYVSVNLVVSSSDDFCTMEARCKSEEEATQSFITVEGPIVSSDTQWQLYFGSKVSHCSRKVMMRKEVPIRRA